MRAVICRGWGGPGDLVVGDAPVPEPGPGDVAIDVHAAAMDELRARRIAGKTVFAVRPDGTPSEPIIR